MKVKKLIEALSKTNPDFPVFISVRGTCFVAIDTVEATYPNAVLIKPHSKLEIVREPNTY